LRVSLSQARSPTVSGHPATAGGILLIGAVALFVFSACDAATAPTLESVVGSYVASTFTLQSGPAALDMLSQGAWVNLTLAPEGRTLGHVYLPAPNDTSADFDADLAGEWVFHDRDTTVTIEHTPGTFLRDIRFHASGDSLAGSVTHEGTTARIALTRTDEGTVAVVLEPSAATLTQDDMIDFVASLLGLDGARAPAPGGIHWAVSDSSLASIDQLGHFVGLDSGDVTVFGESDRVWGMARVRVTPRFESVSTRVSHSCGISTLGPTYCWGLNTGAQLGVGSFDQGRLFPTATAGGSSPAFASISTGRMHTCALTADGHLYCWGSNYYGELGELTVHDQCEFPFISLFPCNLTPQRALDTLTFRSVSAGLDYSCGVTVEGTIICWGMAPPPPDSVERSGPYGPFRVPSVESFRDVSVGEFFACAVAVDHRAYCWGSNGHYQLGDGTTENSRDTPTLVTGGLLFASVSAGWSHTCGLTEDGKAYCWGRNVEGQLGTGGTPQFSSTPVPVAGELTFAAISAGAGHTCGITQDRRAYCWGSNDHGELGSGTYVPTTTPAAVATELRFTSISAGLSATCGITATTDALMCWGWNDSGQLGDGTMHDRRIPVPAFGLPGGDGS
jgi:alpha-tubulin suppressor-like RCC1 family protein